MHALLDPKLLMVFHVLIVLYSPELSGSGFSTFPFRMVASASSSLSLCASL